MNSGDLVRIAPRWLNSGEDARRVYRVSGPVNGQRCVWIIPTVTGLPIPKAERVSVGMLIPVCS